MNVINYLKVALFGYIFTGAQAYAQTVMESAAVYDKCQTNVPACQQAAKQGNVDATYSLYTYYQWRESPGIGEVLKYLQKVAE